MIANFKSYQPPDPSIRFNQTIIMSNNQSSPDYPDDMRDLFEVSEDENVNSSGHQSPELSTQETSGELRQSKTKRKRSEDVANPTSPNDSDQKDMV